MDTPKPRHNLFNVDLENRTATCAVCGDTQIYVNYDRRADRLKPSCSNRMKAGSQVSHQRLQEQKRTTNPDWKPRHKVSDIDIETMTGICCICGPTIIRRSTVYNKKKYTAYRCVTKVQEEERERWSQYRTLHPRTFKSSLVGQVHENRYQMMIDEHKVKHGCKSCGFNSDPLELELHFLGLDETEFTESKLVNFKQRRLVHALQISEVYCVRCHPLVHGEPSLQIETPPIP